MGKTVMIFIGVLAVLVVLYAGIQYGLYPSYYAGLVREKLRQADFNLCPGWQCCIFTS
ncbi:hypothetical protein WMW72_30125 [Paenibacillus filicis]|uniref:Uncharacterized protein n=1 Tax=Paenibacillus filicis TaxID=669464 RepID=A0ABU9DTZ5_9BACL